MSVSGLCSDAPATSFALNIAAHNAYCGCRKCTTVGLWVGNRITCHTQAKTGGRVTYPELDAPLRTDRSFRDRLQPKHHNKDNRRSIVEDVLSDVVEDVCLDYLHVVCIGVYKKKLKVCVSGKDDRIRFSSEDIKAISAYRKGIRKYIPRNFARKTRPIEELPRWKATELRLDLLYICPVSYKPFLSVRRYKHLMLLHVGIKLLVNKDSCQSNAMYADKLLRQYVTASVKLYGAQYVSFNVHNLIHLANDVLKHGCLDDFSAFPFENKLQKIKNLLRKSGKPLQQIVRRLDEINRSNFDTHRSHLNNGPQLSGFHCSGPLLPQYQLRSEQYKKLHFKNSILTACIPDNCVFVVGQPNQIVVIKNFVKFQGQIYVLGNRYLKLDDMYTYPLPSSRLNEILASQLSPNLEAFRLIDVLWKAVRIPTTIPENESFFVCPLLNHSVF